MHLHVKQTGWPHFATLNTGSTSKLRRKRRFERANCSLHWPVIGFSVVRRCAQCINKGVAATDLGKQRHKIRCLPKSHLCKITHQCSLGCFRISSYCFLLPCGVSKYKLCFRFLSSSFDKFRFLEECSLRFVLIFVVCLKSANARKYAYTYFRYISVTVTEK